MNEKRSTRHRKWKRAQSNALQDTLKAMGGVPKGMTVDHEVSKLTAFNRGYEPEQCASKENISFIPLDQNIKKGSGITEKGLAIMAGWDRERAIKSVHGFIASHQLERICHHYGCAVSIEAGKIVFFMPDHSPPKSVSWEWPCKNGTQLAQLIETTFNPPTP